MAGQTLINNVSFYALTTHYFDENIILKANLLECFEFPDKHTAENIAMWIDNVLKKFSIQYKICTIVTDNAANIKLAVEKLNIRHISCFAHTVNLVVQNAIDNSVKELIEKISHYSVF